MTGHGIAAALDAARHAAISEKTVGRIKRPMRLPENLSIGCARNSEARNDSRTAEKWSQS